jgi:hypothetical protein
MALGATIVDYAMGLAAAGISAVIAIGGTAGSDVLGFTVGGIAGVSIDRSGTQLVIRNNANALALPDPPTPADTLLHVGGLEATPGRILIDTFGGSPTFSGRRANGTNAARTGCVDGNVLAAMEGRGYHSGADYSSGARASVQIQSAETWSGTNQGTRILFTCTPLASTTQAAAFTLTSISATFSAGVMLRADADADGDHAIGRCRMGLPTAGTADVAYWAHYDNFGDAVSYALNQTAAGAVGLNTKTGQSLFIRVGGSSKIILTSSAAAFQTGVVLSVADTTASTTTTTGCAVFSGGVGIAGALTLAGGSWSSGGTVSALASFSSAGSITTFAGSGTCRMYRCGGTIATSGDMIFQSDAVGSRDFCFAAGAATAIVAKILSTGAYQIAGLQIISTRKTGWTVATGTPTRTAFDTASVTLPQLAERVKALIDDLHQTAGHGLIGT